MAMEKDVIFETAERYVKATGRSVFLTGKAGTGKTTFLKYITRTTSKRFVVLAPTGVAAINAGGSTIHSFFQLPLCPYLPDVKELVTEYQMPEQYRSLRKERVKIIRTLDLKRPIYAQTAAYGHFGRNDLDLPWEKTDKVAALKEACKAL